MGFTPLEAGVRLAPYAPGDDDRRPAVGPLRRAVRHQGGRGHRPAHRRRPAARALSFISVSTRATRRVLAGCSSWPSAWASTMAPATESVMGSLPREKAGVGSAVNDTTRQVGGALGVAVIGSLVSSVYAAQHQGPERPPASRPPPSTRPGGRSARRSPSASRWAAVPAASSPVASTQLRRRPVRRSAGRRRRRPGRRRRGPRLPPGPGRRRQEAGDRRSCSRTDGYELRRRRWSWQPSRSPPPPETVPASPDVRVTPGPTGPSSRPRSSWPASTASAG